MYLEVEVRESDRVVKEPGEVCLAFRRVYSPYHSETTIERLTDGDLEKVANAIHAHLAAG